MSGLVASAAAGVWAAAARADLALQGTGLAPLATDPDGTWFNNRYIVQEFWPKALDTLSMTMFSTLITVALGLPLGLALVATSAKGLAPNRTLNSVIGTIVNVGRSIPFIILMVIVAPLTRIITGTTITWQSAVVPLTIAAIPFFARLVETSVLAVDQGKVEAALMMGASNNRVMWDVQVRESLPALIQNVTVLIVTLIGYTAMAGAIGSGGLGQLAINNGYMRNAYDVMYIAVGGILVMVMVFQLLGDMLSRLVDHSRR